MLASSVSEDSLSLKVIEMFEGTVLTNFAPIVFFFFFLPEMKDRSLEELDELFQNRVPVRGFAKYQCVSSERAKEIALKGMNDQKGEAVVETVEDAQVSKV